MKRSLSIVLALGVTAVVAMLLSAVQPLARAAASGSSDQYLSPSEIAFSPDGQFLYVVCERSDQLLVLSAKDGNVLQRVTVGHIPRSVAVSPDGRQLFVTNSWDDTVSIIESPTASNRTYAATRKIATGAEPYGIVIDHAGKTLYVANRISNDISVIDIATGVERKRLMAGRGASYLAISADGTPSVLHPRLSKDRCATHSTAVRNHGYRHSPRNGS